MAILLFCSGLVVMAVVLHLLLLRFRFRLFDNPIVVILFIFIFVLFFGLISAYFLSKKYAFIPHEALQYLHVVIFYVPVMFSYIITYVALEDDSPSMTIARFVEQAKEKGRTREEIGKIINNESLVFPRINTMLKDGWIEFDNKRYLITQKGRFYNQFFVLGLKLLNIHREG